MPLYCVYVQIIPSDPNEESFIQQTQQQQQVKVQERHLPSLVTHEWYVDIHLQDYPFKWSLFSNDPVTIWEKGLKSASSSKFVKSQQKNK